MATDVSTIRAEEKFKNPGERFDRSVDRVAVGKSVILLPVKTYVETRLCK